MVGFAMLVAALGAAFAGLFVRAVRGEHLLVLRGSGRAVRYFERRPDGGWGPIPGSDVPRAVWRFARGVPAAVRLPVAPDRRGRSGAW